ncbi:putative RNA-directed DNA polymerase [Tanacetum coccineum]
MGNRIRTRNSPDMLLGMILQFEFLSKKYVDEASECSLGLVLQQVSPSMDAILNAIIPFARRRSSRSVIAKLVVAATAYFIWQERNYRLFKKMKRSKEQLVDCISSSIRLKLLSCRFKSSRDGLALLRHWKISDSELVVWHVIRLVRSSSFLLEVNVFKDDKKDLFCSFIYAHNQYMQRRALWNNLDTHKAYIRDRPWCILGDFNVSLHAHDKSTGTSYIDRGMKDFQECVDSIGVYDVNCTGLRYTWNQKPMGGDGILKKIDRIMANSEFYRVFVVLNLLQPYRISDHTPAVLRIPMTAAKRPRPFKFYNILVQHDRFAEIVLNGWTENVIFHDNVVNCGMIIRAQTALDSDPNNIVLREEEASYLHAYTDALLLEEKFLSQKAKIEWLKLGDANTAYFHQVVKGQASRNRIDCITNSNGLSIDGEQVPMAFVDHYTEFLGQQGTTTIFDTENLFCNTLSEDIANHMVREVTDQEIRKAMFSIGDNKAPGPDGYSAAFFKEAWNIVGTDVTKAIKEFFTNGVLLKELNHTIIALIPKVNNPMRINDYRPISCCNVLFKCISSIISNRMKGALNELVNINQSAFVPGRRISDNILLTQELMHNYHLDRGVPRCAFKVDIQKAYDTVDWNFLRAVLVGFGFHHRMIGWIMECVTSTSFSISINGCLRGLRQGDPLSPYLFTLVMEVLTLMLHRRARVTNSFTYHRYCSKLNIINLCFADDLFLFAHGDVDSARVIMDSLDEFKNASGLTPSLPKSTAYFCNVLNYVKIGILAVLPFEEEKLPVKYLGVPLVPSRFVYRDCAELVERVKRRISDWKNKFLSFAGRAQLVRSVLSSMHIYWASMFILPSSLILELEQLMRGFLWCQALNDIVEFLIPFAKMKSIRIVICKLVFAAACYFIWQERNFRIFKKKKRTQDQIVELIKSNVRLKLLTCSFKKTHNVQMLMHLWKLPESLELLLQYFCFEYRLGHVLSVKELAILCPNMVPNAEKLMEVFINGLPRSIEGNVTASIPQTLEEAINIAQRLIDQNNKA